MTAGAHRHVNNTAGPDVNSSRIELFFGVFLRRDVWRTAAQTHSHVRFGLPCHSETFAVSEIGNLQRAVRGQEQVLWLQVAVRYAHLMDVLDTAHELQEIAIGF